MTLKTLCLAATLFLVTHAHAQRKVKQMDSDKEEQEQKVKEYEKKPWTDKILFGGSAGASFSSSSAYFMIQPVAAYQVTEHFLAGVGITYNYWSQTITFLNTTYEFSDHAYGLNLFARHRVVGPLFAHVEYMPMNFTSYNMYGDRRRIWGHSLLLGGGLQQTSGRSGFYMLFLYDVLWRPYDRSLPGSFVRSYRASPIDLRVGLFF